MPTSGNERRRHSATGAEEGAGATGRRRFVGIAAGLAVTCATLLYAEGSSSRCQARARALFGDRADVTGDSSDDFAPPTLWQRAPLDLPDRWPTACKGTMLSHDLLIDESGGVRELFTRRSPCGEFDRAVRLSLRRWTYQPALRAGQPVAACVVVSTTIHPR